MAEIIQFTPNKILSAQRNLQNLITLSRDHIVSWADPIAFYRHEDCPDIVDDKELTRDQVAQALGVANRKSSQDFIFRHTGKRGLKGFTLNSL